MIMKLYDATAPRDDEATPLGDDDIIDVKLAPTRRPPPLPPARGPVVAARAAA